MNNRLQTWIKCLLIVSITIHFTACATNFRQGLQNLEAHNYPEALSFFEKDAKLGYRIPAIYAAELYILDYQVPRNLERSQFYLNTALKADYGNYDQAYDYFIPLIKAYQILADTNQADKSQAFNILHYAKYQNYYWALAELAHCNLVGYGTELNLNKAKMYFERSINNKIFNSANTFYAWWLATYPDDSFRDPKRAFNMIQDIINDKDMMNKPLTLDTVAAVYAINGDFEKAKKTQKKAIALLNTYILKYPYMKQYETTLKARLDSYQKDQAWVFSLPDIKRCGYDSKRCLKKNLTILENEHKMIPQIF